MESKTIGQVLREKTPKKRRERYEKSQESKPNRMLRRKKGERLEPEGPAARKKGRKTLKIVFLLVFAILILTVLFVWIIDGRVEKIGRSHVLTVDQLSKDYDCVIVPGAAVYQNSVPSPMLADRLDVALQIYEKGLAPKILVSGDNGTEEYNEVGVMRDYLIGKGVPREDIFMDYAGFDTYQTMYRARDIFLVKKAVVVTQDFHLYRALYIGEKLSLELDGVDSAVRDYHNGAWNRSREYLARVKAFLECEIFKPLPKFLGDTVPISGNGNA